MSPLAVRRGMFAFLSLLFALFAVPAWALTLTPNPLPVPVGANATSTVSGTNFAVHISQSPNPAIATASVSGNIVTVHGVAVGNTTVRISDGGHTNSSTLTVNVTATANQAPSCTITSPAANTTITAGQSVNFAGTGTDPDNNTPLTYSWSLPGGTPSNSTAQNPGNVTYASAGTFTATFTVRDSRGLACTTPATRTITVSPVQVNHAPNGTITSPAGNVAIQVGQSVKFEGSGTDPDGDAITFAWNFGNGQTSTLQNPESVAYTSAGTFTATLTVTDNKGLPDPTPATVTVTVTAAAQSPGIPVSGPGATTVILAANDLGMHCTDQDFQVFSILPPFNVVHAQVVRKGTGTTSTTLPSILNGTQADVYYSPALNPNDPVSASSINTGNAVANVFKTNFWQVVNGTNQTLGSQTYRGLYPVFGGAPSALDLFSPIANDIGLPVPDPNALPALSPFQQEMPSVFAGAPNSAPQKFGRYYTDLAFFTGLSGLPWQFGPVGQEVLGAKWFAAEGVPILPIDDAGLNNAYPLMRVAAVSPGTSPTTAANVLAAVDVVLPVASEADCQICHAAISDPGLVAAGQTSSGAATDFASVTFNFVQSTDAGIPGPQKLLNAAKINVLRLHDKKHGAAYMNWDATGALVAAPCSGTEASCLDVRRNIQCSQCHYTPALDLAQVGPIDEPAQGPNGRQQAHHISMSNAMHGFHGGRIFNGTALFPDMPAPGTANRTPTTVSTVLQQTCYACHPGKRTACLRGAMFTGGVVCQDCHGNMKQVGSDFSTTLPQGSIDFTKRVPWANEPKCQSCHVGDAMTGTRTSDMIVAPDGIRLLQAYTKTDATNAALNNTSLPNIQAPTSRFAEDKVLYRLSGAPPLDASKRGHAGLMCKACHGSTHSEWPVGNPTGKVANDNVAATQLQGHTGKITECSVCHGTTNLGVTLNGPHGIHPVGTGTSFSGEGGHPTLARSQTAQCQACHGRNGQGTVLSKLPVARTLGGTSRPAGYQVSCGTCHSNFLSTGVLVGGN